MPLLMSRPYMNTQLPSLALVSVGLTCARFASASFTVGTMTNSAPLNTSGSGCYAPYRDGGWGFCGPFSCTSNYDTCVEDDGSGGGPLTIDGVSGSWATSEGDCKPFLASSYDDDEDIADWNPSKSCDNSCSQQTTGVCSADFLAGVLKGSGVKYAYCNEDYLFMYTDGVPTIWTANLNDVPYPPGDSSGDYRTGMESLDVTRGQELYFPLDVTLLPSADSTNNVDVWEEVTYLYGSLFEDGKDRGIPADSGIGVSVSGQSIYPIYNNVAAYTPQQCEVDSCNEHVGQGGGQPHLHGDPFGDEAPTKCLYGPSNYTGDQYGETGHPPLMGFGADGILIYGRYLYETQLGFQSPLLDTCGGHTHTTSASSAQDPYGLLDEYHYHTQVFDATADSSAVADEDDSYTVSTSGPFNCYRANLTASKGSMALYEAAESLSDGKSTMENRCCDMTDYYILTGLSFPDSGSKVSVASSSTCSSPAAPANGYHSGVCSTEGTTMYSGWSCNVTCNDGFYLNGTTQCVGGVLKEASCDPFAPSAVPVPTPTAVPVPAPSNAPTSAPSAAPTDAPVRSPTRAPISAPTKVPTPPPTVEPTAVPLPAPTPSPSIAPTTTSYATVEASMTMTGLNASQVDDDDLAAITTGLASVLDGVEESDITDVTVTDATRRRRLATTSHDPLAGAAPGVRASHHRMLASASATVSFKVALDVDDSSSFSDASDLYSSVTSDLSDVDSDSTDLVTAIQDAATSSTFSSVEEVTSTSTVLVTRSPTSAPVPPPTFPPSSSGDDGSSGGNDKDSGGSDMMGLFIGLGVGLPLLGAGAFYGFKVMSEKGGEVSKPVVPPSSLKSDGDSTAAVTQVNVELVENTLAIQGASQAEV